MKLLDIVACSVSLAALLPEPIQAAPVYTNTPEIPSETVSRRAEIQPIVPEKRTPQPEEEGQVNAISQGIEIHLKREESVPAEKRERRRRIRAVSDDDDEVDGLEKREPPSNYTNGGYYCTVM